MNKNKAPRGLGSFAMIWPKDGIGYEPAVEHWRTQHGRIAADLPGCETYRQYHYAEHPLLPLPGYRVNTDCAEEWIPLGFAESLMPSYLAAVKSSMSPVKKKAFADEGQVDRRLVMYVTAKSGCVFHADDLTAYGADHVMSGNRIALVFGRGGSRGQFKRLISRELPQMLLSKCGVKELHAFLFMPYSKSLWPSPDVDREHPKKLQYQGALLIGVPDGMDARQILEQDEVRALVNANAGCLSFMQAFQIEHSYMMRDHNVSVWRKKP